MPVRAGRGTSRLAASAATGSPDSSLDASEFDVAWSSIKVPQTRVALAKSAQKDSRYRLSDTAPTLNATKAD